MIRVVLALFFALFAVPATAQTIPSGPVGSINYWGVGGLSTVLAPGLAGQCLQTQAVGSAPIWTTCFTIPPQNANTILANVTTNFVAPQAVDINRVLDTVGYDIARPPAPLSILYKSNVGPTFNWQALPPGVSGALLTSGGPTNPPFWSANTIQASLAAICTNPGAILYFDPVTAWTCLAPGVSGQLLQTGGAAANPSWLTLAATTPISISGGVIACPTCATTTNGGALSATAPLTISAGGSIACATCATGAVVASFNSRTGAVVPLLGDYNAPLINYTAPGTGGSTITQQLVNQRWVFASDYGVVNDGTNIGKVVSTTSGASTLTVSTAQFASTDCQTGTGCTGPVNKAIMVYGAGASGAPYSGTITGFTSSTVVTVSGTFGTTLSSSSQTITYGTDNSAKLQNWINRLQATQAIGVFDPCSCTIATALSVTSTVNIIGSGSPSGLLLASPTIDAIDINTNSPVYLSKFTISGSTAATNGNMISNTGPSGIGNAGSVFRDLQVTGGFRGYSDGSSAQWIIDGSIFNAQTAVGIQTANALSCSAGNKFITNSTVDIPASSTYTAGLLMTDSGMIFAHNKINGGTGGFDILIQPASTCTIPSDIIITDNSLEGAPLTACVQMVKGSFTGAQYPNIVIANNEIGCGSPNGISLGDANANWIKHVNITGNQLYGGSGGTALILTNSVVDASVTGNTFESAGGSTTAMNISSTVAGTARGNSFDASLSAFITNASPAFLAELSVGGHVNYVGVAPTASACGTSPSVAAGSTDQSGTVTTGSTATTNCTITFAKAYAVAPRCTAMNSGGGVAVTAASTTTSALTFSYASATSNAYTWMCNGN